MLIPEKTFKKNFFFMLFYVNFQKKFTDKPRVYGFVNFGHRHWWYRGHFCKKAGKKLEKKIIFKRNNLKKRKKPGDGSKIRNKLCIKNEVFSFICIK